MGDQQNSGALRTQVVQHFEQVAGFLGRQYGGRFVQNQNFGAPVQRFKNFKSLLIAYWQIAGQRIQLDVKPGVLHQLF